MQGTFHIRFAQSMNVWNNISTCLFQKIFDHLILIHHKFYLKRRQRHGIGEVQRENSDEHVYPYMLR